MHGHTKKQVNYVKNNYVPSKKLSKGVETKRIYSNSNKIAFVLYK